LFAPQFDLQKTWRQEGESEIHQIADARDHSGRQTEIGPERREMCVSRLERKE